MTVVDACCVDTEGMLLTERPKSGLLLTIDNVSKIVPASVIWGRTVKLSEKSWYCVLIVLFTLVWTGI